MLLGEFLGKSVNFIRSKVKKRVVDALSLVTTVHPPVFSGQEYPQALIVVIEQRIVISCNLRSHGLLCVSEIAISDNAF